MKHTTKIIDVRGVSKRYKKTAKPAVDAISFYVEKGSFFSLLGPNGAGKTTTISILTTTLSKTSGTIKIAGYDLDKESHKIRRNIGVIFQNPSLDLNLTAEENVRIHAILYGLYPYRPAFSLMPKQYRDKVMELADVLDIRDDIHKPIKTFSGGMKRKLEIIRSLTHNPKILFLDEPTTGLDPLSRKNLWQYLQYVREQEKTTIFLTTHYLEEAEESDYICIMDKGKIVSRGTPREIKRELIEEYILVKADDNERLITELKKKKIIFDYAQKKNGTSMIKLKIGNQTPHEILRKISTPLTHLDIHTPTLEEAYLEIINTDNKAQSKTNNMSGESQLKHEHTSVK